MFYGVVTFPVSSDLSGCWWCNHLFLCVILVSIIVRDLSFSSSIVNLIFEVLVVNVVGKFLQMVGVPNCESVIDISKPYR